MTLPDGKPIEVTLTLLRCRDGCGGKLVITDRNLAECEYCHNKYLVTNLPDIVMQTDERYVEPEDNPLEWDTPYFLKGGVGERWSRW